MPVLVSQRWSDRKLSKIPGNWTAEESWDVVGTSAMSDAIESAVSASAAHPDNPAMRAYERTAEANKGTLAWIVRAKFKFGSFPDNKNPLITPQKIKWEPSTETVPIDRDLNYYPIVNSAYGTPSPLPTERRTVLCLTVTRAEPFFNVQKPLAYMNYANTNSFTIAGAGGVQPSQAFCELIAPTTEYTTDAPFVMVVYKFKFMDGLNPFQLKLLDKGREGWYSDSGTLKRGLICYPGLPPTPVAEDVFLNGFGVPLDTTLMIMGAGGSLNAPAALSNTTTPPLPNGLIIDPVSTAAAKYLLWTNVQKTDFSGLGL